MAAMSPSGSRNARRDQRVRRIHIRDGGDRTLCNRPKSDGDVVVTLYGYVGDKLASNACKICRRIWLR